MGLDFEQLKETLQLLSLIHVRNKNQHRHQKWWKWLNVFRRNVRTIVELLETEQERRRELLRGIRSNDIWSEDKDKNERRLDQTLEWMRRVGIERCWVAFTSLVSDTQFSVLGVVLIAALARFAKVIGYKPSQESISRQAASQSTSTDPSSHRPVQILGNASDAIVSADIDLGVAISRNQLLGPNEPPPEIPCTLEALPTASPPSSASKPPTIPHSARSAAARVDTQEPSPLPPPPLPAKRKRKPNRPEAPSPPPPPLPSNNPKVLPPQPGTSKKKHREDETRTHLQPTPPSSSAPTTKKKKKKKEKSKGGGGNAIDDLFADLL